MKLAPLPPRSQSLQPIELLRMVPWGTALAALLAISVVGCSSEDRVAETLSPIDREGELSNPPLAPPYLTDLKEGSDQGVTMRFGELGDAAASQTGTDQTGTDQTGTDQTGTDQTGTDQTGTDQTAQIRLAQIRLVRAKLIQTRVVLRLPARYLWITRQMLRRWPTMILIRRKASLARGLQNVGGSGPDVGCHRAAAWLHRAVWVHWSGSSERRGRKTFHFDETVA